MRRRINFTYYIFILVFLVALKPCAFSQLSKQQKLDSLHTKFVKDSAHIYRFKKVKPLIVIDKRNSFIHTNTKTSVDVNGLQLGVELYEKHSLGLGFYSVLHSQAAKPIVDEQNHLKTIYINLKMSYTTIFYEYLLVDTKRWEIGIPVEIGGGNYQITATDSIGRRIATFKDTLKRGILVLGAGLNIDFKIFKWLGVNAMGGYRIVGGNEPSKINFNGAFYSLGVQIYFGELIKMGRLGLKRRLYKNEVRKLNTH